MWIAITIIAVVLVAIVFIYNSLVRANVRTEEAWSDITVQLKRRLDLIPNLVNTVKGYASHEKEVFEKVTQARAQALNASGVKETAEAENQFEGALKSLFAVAEAYPDLKASDNFRELQTELVDTENKIQAARRFYNGAVRDLNIKTQVFPTNLIAGMLGFTEKEFFEVEDMATVREPVDVQF
ncbi:MAG: LemA family protein [Candidatus Saccharimonadales bacterium]